MIETYRNLHMVFMTQCDSDTAVLPVLPICDDSVKGKCLKISSEPKSFSKYDMRKYVFIQRIINIWSCHSLVNI